MARDCQVCRRLIRSFFFSKGVASTGVDMRKRASWQLGGFRGFIPSRIDAVSKHQANYLDPASPICCISFISCCCSHSFMDLMNS